VSTLTDVDDEVKVKVAPKDEDLWCSFCGKTRADVRWLIQGGDAGVCICNECLAAATKAGCAMTPTRVRAR